MPENDNTREELNQMSEVIVTKEVLDLYEKYNRDFGLLHERWADKKDREKLTSQQIFVFSQFINNLGWLKVDNISQELRTSFESKIEELERLIDPEVSKIVRERVALMNDDLY